jgi:hypothetical protein
MAWLARLVDNLDRITPGWLLLPNAFIALWVLLAHGGSLLLVRLGKIPASDFGDSLDYAYLTIVPAAAILVLTLFAWVRPAVRVLVLRVHAVILLVLAAYVLYDALEVVAYGVPTVKRFSWDVGAFVFLLAYPVYLARRALLPASVLRNVGVRYAHIGAVVVAIAISLLVFWRIDAAA